MISKKIAMVFPGQGSQSLGMLKDLASQNPVILTTFEEASDKLSYDLWQVTQTGPIEKLNQTEITQPALLTASVALWRLWQQLGGVVPAVLAGHSLGEYSALVCAKAIAFTDAVALVASRGRYMQEAVKPGSGAMAAVIGLDEGLIIELCEKASSSSPSALVSPANFNAPGQIVIAGHVSAVEAVMQLAKLEGAKLIKKLDVSVPSHCMLMQEAAEKLAHDLNQITWHIPEIPVLHNVDVAVHQEINDIKIALQRQLYSPVRWVQTVQKMQNNYQIEEIIECGPGKILTGLNKRIVDVPVMSISNLESLKEVIEHA